MENLFRLVYRSYRMVSCDEIEVEKILSSSRQNNSVKNITGILLHADRKFIQYLEGAESEVKELFDIIKEDNRHASVSQLDYSRISKRLFPSWQMGYKDVSKGIMFNTPINAHDKECFEKLLMDDLDFSNDGMRILQLYFQRV